MKTQIQQILSRAEGRYLSEVEVATLRTWAGGLDERMAAMEELRRAEEAIVQAVMKRVTTAYPDFLNRHAHGSDSGIRDITIVLRYAAHAMVIQDMTYLEDNLLSWLNTVLRGIGFTPDFIADAYGTLESAARQQLSAKAASLIGPYLEHCRLSLSSRETPIAAARG
jgi:hypothetical protein